MIVFNRKLLYSIFGVAILLFLFGCKESGRTQTDEMQATIEFDSTENSSEVEVSLRTVSDDLSLSYADSMYADVDGVREELHRRSLFDSRYYAVFDFNSENRTLVLSLIRPNHTDAPNSTVVMPARIYINTPNADDIYMNGEDMAVTWSPSVPNSDASIIFAGSCNNITPGLPRVDFHLSRTTPDNGSFTIPVIDILDEEGEHNIMDPDSNCTCRISIVRTRHGTLDPNFSRGSIIARQVTHRNVYLDP